jgi:mono/diheme cytochrome c family protein
VAQVKTSLQVAVMCCLALGAVMPALAQDAGADVYKQKCSLCHGDTGKGDTPAGQAFKAASFSDPAVIKVSDADRALVIKNGKGKMPAFGDSISPDQVKAVLAYIRTLEKK